MEEFKHYFRLLAEGKDLPLDWWNWWQIHEKEIEGSVSRGDYLRWKMYPYSRVLKHLDDEGVNYVCSDRYAYLDSYREGGEPTSKCRRCGVDLRRDKGNGSYCPNGCLPRLMTKIEPASDSSIQKTAEPEESDPLRHRQTITTEFLKKIANEGALAKACARLAASPRNDLAPILNWSTWRLVCEEVLDSELDDADADQIIRELHRRGLSNDQINEMRMFAWRTAGWLNFEKMLWEWVSLSEDEIYWAIRWLERDGEITAEQRLAYELYVARFSGGNQFTARP